MKRYDRNPSDPEDDANCFAPLAGYLSELRASARVTTLDRFDFKGCSARHALYDKAVMYRLRTTPDGALAPP